MTRRGFLLSVLIPMATCTPGAAGPELTYVEVVGDIGSTVSTLVLSPDGTRLAWTQFADDGRWLIHVANVDGSNVVRLTNGTWDRNAVWSPNGQWIAYLAQAPDLDLFVVSADGGEPRQLTSGPSEDRPTGWLPDGSGVVFWRTGAGDVQTLVAPLNGDPVHPLVPPLGGNQYASISPDGLEVASYLERGGEGTIWVQDLAGGPARQLTNEGLEYAGNLLQYPNMWSPDSRKVVYMSRRTGTSDIWTVDVESGDLLQLTNDVRTDSQPWWSPDGRWIAFYSDRGGQPDLWIVPSSGGQALRVTNDGYWDGYPAWSPDGRTLYFMRVPADYDLRVIPAEGGAARVLAGWPGADHRIEVAELSPDGNTVLFHSNRSGNYDIWSVPFAGGEPVPFAASPLGDLRPRFSPDGSRVLFESNRAGSMDLWVVPATGGEPRSLTDWPSVEGPEKAWSPDGSRIAFASNHDGSWGVWIVPAVSGAARRVTSVNGSDISSLQWSPGGESLYFVGWTDDGTHDLFRVPAVGGQPEGLGAAAGIVQGVLSPDGAQFVYATAEGGWLFMEAIATAGGVPRRLTTLSERVVQVPIGWSPDGSRVILLDSDLVNDQRHLAEMSWPDGVVRRLTPNEPHVANTFHAFSPDGRQILFTRLYYNYQIFSVSVAELLAGR